MAAEEMKTIDSVSEQQKGLNKIETGITDKIKDKENKKAADETAKKVKNHLKKVKPIQNLNDDLTKEENKGKVENNETIAEKLDFKKIDFFSNMPDNLKEIAGKKLEGKEFSTLEEFNKAIYIALIAEKTHLFATGTETKITTLKEAQKNGINAFSEMKNPFPNGEDNIQKKLSIPSVNNEFPYFTDQGLIKNGSIVENNENTLASVLKDDLNPLNNMSDIAKDNLYNVLKNNNFSIDDAKVIQGAMQGQKIKIQDLQTALSHISTEFQEIVGKIDDKYGKDTRKAVRSLAINLAIFVENNVKEVVTYKKREVKKWFVKTKVVQNFGGRSVEGYEYNSKDIQAKIQKQKYDNQVTEGDTKNSNIIVPIYDELKDDRDNIIHEIHGKPVIFQSEKHGGNTIFNEKINREGISHKSSHYIFYKKRLDKLKKGSEKSLKRAKEALKRETDAIKKYEERNNITVYE